MVIERMLETRRILEESLPSYRRPLRRIWVHMCLRAIQSGQILERVTVRIDLLLYLALRIQLRGVSGYVELRFTAANSPEVIPEMIGQVQIPEIAELADLSAMERIRQKAPSCGQKRLGLLCLRFVNNDGRGTSTKHLPEPRGVNVAAAAAFGDMPRFLTGCTFPVLGVKEGESTVRDFFALSGFSIMFPDRSLSTRLTCC